MISMFFLGGQSTLIRYLYNRQITPLVILVVLPYALIKMPQNRDKNPTEKEWLYHKPTLKRLWLNDKLRLQGEKGVMDVMKTKYNFIASSEKSIWPESF